MCLLMIQMDGSTAANHFQLGDVKLYCWTSWFDTYVSDFDVFVFVVFVVCMSTGVTSRYLNFISSIVLLVYAATVQIVHTYES